MKEKYYQNLLNKEYKHCKEIVIKLPDSINDTYKDVFWLINDRQIKIIDQLEKNGWDEKIKDLFFFNNNLFDELEDSISEYETIRQNIIKDFYNVGKKEKIKNTNNLVLNRDERINIECLHYHYAHYLATGNNPIGKIVSLLIQKYEELANENDNNEINEYRRGVEQTGSSLGS